MPGVIDSRRWLRQRINYLEQMLAANPSSEERARLESELAETRAELRRGARWLDWLFFGARR